MLKSRVIKYILVLDVDLPIKLIRPNALEHTSTLYMKDLASSNFLGTVIKQYRPEKLKLKQENCKWQFLN